MQKIRSIIVIITLALCYGTIVNAQDVYPSYDAPDQVIWHRKTRTWFVSNLGGGISLKKDHNGWITQTDEKGKVLHEFWIGKTEGMHAPSGMTITDDYLYVCDREGVYEIDIAKRKVNKYFAIAGASFINDIAMAANGDLFVSDFFSNKIYKIPQTTRISEVWLETDQLKSPDGLYIDDNHLIVASWGKLINKETFATSELGDLLSIDLKTKKIETLIKQIGNLEGITKVGKHYFITDWAAGKVLMVDAAQKIVTDFIVGLKNPTDPDYSPELNVLAFPQHGTNQVLFIKLDSDNTLPIASYNYGGLNKISPKEQVQILSKYGYDGIVLKSETKEDFNNIDEFIGLTENGNKIKIISIFERYNFNDSVNRRERWKEVVDKIADKEIQLWVIFGKKVDGITDDFVEQKLREINLYAAQKKVAVILYPHSDTYISSAEQALLFVKKINDKNLKLALHLYHEVRAGNGSRIDQVFENVKNYLGAVTLAGTDIIADYTNSKTRDMSTIKPIGYGDFNLANFIKPLLKSNYKGSLAFMNFGITESPDVYLPRSLAEWKKINSLL
jgi:sugar phosphate isomerase/epimerase